ncbi:MAG: hypothetical protein GXP25_03210 [Planctomycetes bacterium]|nr:hypothetical protein [Planctomycetota bacterium]
MSFREILVLFIITALVLGAVGGYVALVKSPAAPPAPAKERAGETAAPQPFAPAASTEDYSPIWRTITRPPAPEPARPAAPKPMRKLHLKGIVSQATERMAVIEDSTGRQRLVAEGGAIEGARVTKISPRSVTLEAGGKTTVLQLEKKIGAKKVERNHP